MQLVDTHAHLDDEQFGENVTEVLSRARQAGVAQVIAVGITADSSRQTVELADRYDGVFAAVGIHPNSAALASEDDWQQILRLAQRPKVVALGETGLDRYRDATPLEVQRAFFERHLRLSQETGLPLVIHCRDAHPQVLNCLREAATRGALQGVMHAFTGDLAAARACLELDLYLSFAGMVTFKKSAALREVARTVPRERLLVETDSPYLSPEPHRGKLNEPARAVHTAACLAELHALSIEQFAEQTTANAHRLFRRLAETSDHDH